MHRQYERRDPNEYVLGHLVDQLPITGCRDKKLRDLFFLFVNIFLKHNLNTAEMRYFLLQHIIFSQPMKTYSSICGEKKILSTENNVGPNRDDIDHALLIAIVIDLIRKK
jgi:hypothetical protein